VLIKEFVDKDAEFNMHWKWSIIGDRREDIVIKYEDGDLWRDAGSQNEWLNGPHAQNPL
jgi:hypothetical protein